MQTHGLRMSNQEREKKKGALYAYSAPHSITSLMISSWHRKQSLEIMVSDENINGLVKRGYLDLDEIDDAQAIREALSLFLWDALLGAPRQIASEAAKS